METVHIRGPDDGDSSVSSVGDRFKTGQGSAFELQPFIIEYYSEIGYKIYGQEQVISDDFDYGDYYITDERYRKLENCKIQSGDILISLVGTFGQISIVPNKFEPGMI